MSWKEFLQKLFRSMIFLPSSSSVVERFLLDIKDKNTEDMKLLTFWRAEAVSHLYNESVWYLAETLKSPFLGNGIGQYLFYLIGSTAYKIYHVCLQKQPIEIKIILFFTR